MGDKMRILIKYIIIFVINNIKTTGTAKLQQRYVLQRDAKTKSIFVPFSRMTTTEREEEKNKAR